MKIVPYVYFIVGAGVGMIAWPIFNELVSSPQAHHTNNPSVNDSQDKARLQFIPELAVLNLPSQPIACKSNPQPLLAPHNRLVTGPFDLNSLYLVETQTILDKIEAIKSKKIEQLKALLHNTDDLSEILMLIEDIKLMDDDAMTANQADQILDVVITANDQPLIDRLTALTYISNNISSSQLGALDQLINNESYHSSELAWQALNLINLSPINEDKKQILDNLKQSHAHITDFSTVVDQMLGQMDNFKHLDMRNIMVQKTQKMRQAMLGDDVYSH